MTIVNWKKLSWWVGVLVLLAALAAPELSAAQRSVSAEISESFEFNGEAFQPSKLTVREVSQYNPGTTLNEIWIDGRCWGLMLADVSRAAADPGSDDRILFERNAAGRLVLVGFAYHGEAAREFYGYDELATGGRWSSPARSSKGIAVASQ
ncbi:MAG: hypothetical protein GTO30_15800 [Acidobacteria bacterium]|nr:hypothetical protein [Acidobacteriota bacterium]NIM63044.1 hypothetical protein [Acidobacteriota bacterium]NIO58387.1 hypothetical protein [Acidobacteriota bacterium]NIQ84061.1 hypothetical protein [Acidobacteriota bacterium]NIT10153.1 hypothetical protein [Acidobacteriota bacterium]